MLKRILCPIAAASVFAASLIASSASAAPYVTLKDPAEIAKPDDTPGLGTWRNKLMEQYEALGLELPEVFSIWTAFPMAGNNYGTFIDPRENSVSGIGLPLKESTTPPVKALLWHNNILAMPQRAALHDAPEEGYARYLFLLELSHLWGPQAEVPEPGQLDLIGFSYHWSFFKDEAGPAGGNAWTDNGDGTFTVVPGDPATVQFNMLDLYLMGLAEPEEVTPFGVLINTTVPPKPTDPFWGGAYAGRSFPWFNTVDPPLTITATRRQLTIDDIIAANGPRDPGAGVKTSWTVGIVLIVPAEATDAEIDEAQAAFDPIANNLAPWFNDATQGRGTLEVVSNYEEPMGGGGGGVGGGGTGGSTGETTTSSGSGGKDGGGDGETGEDDGCGCSSSKSGGGAGVLGVALALALALRRERRRAA
jgi:MYXO-CTERM domain-containing protein